MSLREVVNPRELEREEACGDVEPTVRKNVPRTIARVATTTPDYRTVRGANRKQ